MKKYTEQRFIGERALFKSQDLSLSYCTFAEGESPLKESSQLVIDHSMFQWKYPLWYCEEVKVLDSTFFEMARAGIWYTKGLMMERCTYNAPKGFRRCEDLYLSNVNLPQADETLWQCRHVTLNHVTAKGSYFGMNSQDAQINDFTLVGDYAFDGAKNLIIHDAHMLTKDAFWNCENVQVYDSFISGEYFGWNAKNVTLINCVIESEQGFCYMDNVKLENCKLINTTLAFEYSTVDADVTSKIDSVKNPISGQITAPEIGEIIFDNEQMCEEATTIKLTK